MKKYILKHYISVILGVVIIMITLLAVEVCRLTFSKEAVKQPYDNLSTWTWTDGPILSRVDYRFFACGKEYSIIPTVESPVGKGEGLYKRSSVGSIILDGTPNTGWDATLFAFFSAVGGSLYFPADHNGVMVRIPTDEGVLEFNNDNTQCDGKSAQLRVFWHHLLDSKDLDSLKESISWKYFDYLFQNNYGTVPPGDCLVFVFDTEEELEKNWPVCTAYRK